MKDLKLADKSTDGSIKQIGMLIGADIYWKLVNDDIKKDDNSGMIAINSSFGWQNVNFVSSHVLEIECDISEEKLLSNSIHKFYDLDSIGITESEASVYDEFKDKIRLRENGTLGNITYLPHREVIRNDKTTTKVRVVFDASAKKGNNISLNDILYKGPSLTPELFNMLLEFRIYPIAITADIEKAFLQIQVDTDHRDLRFLYYRNIDDPNSEIVRYRFTRVILERHVLNFY